MRTGVTVSAGLHGAVLVLTMIAWPFSSRDQVEQTVLPVELITIADVTNIRQQMEAEEPKPEEEPAQAEETKTAAVEPEAEVPTELAPPNIEQDVEIPEEALEPKPEAVETPKPRPKPPKPPKPRPKEEFNVDSIIGLLDQKQQETADAGPTPAPATSETQTAAVGLATGLTLSELDAFRVQVQRCWNVPLGAPNAEQLIVLVRIQLRPDGTLMTPPEFVDSGRYNSGDGYYRAAADAARRAVIQCQPYTLPSQKYETWREIEMQFDPSMMVGR